MRYLSDDDLTRTRPAETISCRSPIPTQVVSNGEFTPLPQSEDQRRVEARIDSLAEELARRITMAYLADAFPRHFRQPASM